MAGESGKGNTEHLTRVGKLAKGGRLSLEKVEITSVGKQRAISSSIFAAVNVYVLGCSC